MLRRKTSSILTAIAVLAGAGAAFAATAPAQATPTTNVCGDPIGHDQQGPISFSPGFYAVAPATVDINLVGNSITPTCQATLDFGDGQSQVVNSTAKVTHTYAKPGLYKAVLWLNWPGYRVQPIETATFIGQGAKGKANVGRLQGQNRLDTAVQISKNQWLAPDPKSNWGQAHTAVIATSGNFPDALSGVPLAAYKAGPLLLTDKAGPLYGPADAEINRIVPKGSVVYILGGTAAVPATVDTQLSNEGYKVQRFAGANRFETSLMIAQQGLNNPPTVVVATGGDFPDALSAGPLASGPRATHKPDAPAQPAAVVLTNGPGFFDHATAGYVAGKLQTAGAGVDCKAVTAVGGAATKALTPLITAGKCADTGLVGTDRYDTSNLVMNEFQQTYLVGLATGTQFPDALAGGAYVANLEQPLLLTDPNTLSRSVGPWFNGMYAQDGVSDVVVFGGPKAVSDHVVGQVISAAHTGSYYYP